MKATLKIECIGDDSAIQSLKRVAPSLVGSYPARYYVAKITGLDPKYKFKREFLKPNKDYAHANSKGSRGVYAWYVLDYGDPYEVKEPVSWKKTEKYYCRVTETGDIEKLTEGQVFEWVKFF